MTKLTDDEQAQLKALQDKAEAPDEPAPNRTTTINVDLSDEKAVKRAQKLGLLDMFDDDDETDTDEDSDGDEDEVDEEPRRRGYFKN